MKSKFGNQTISKMILSNSIAKRMNEAVTALNDIAEGEGDLMNRLNDSNNSNNDEISYLAKSFNFFSSKIQNMVGQITDSCQVIATNPHDVGASQAPDQKKQGFRSLKIS